jgi:TetR/AcrR family transcriptional regulator, cholesterol catabolism regulator
MVAQHRRATRGAMRRPGRLKPGVKKERILEVAAEHFGRYGYEETKWADVAAEVGIGSTALYHYFESKQHCLFEIMSRTLAELNERFERIVGAHDDWTEALLEVLASSYELTDQEVLKHRVLVAEHGRVATKRSAPREEAARATARALKRDIEFAWAAFLVRGMEQGALPRSDAQLMARAVLGLYNSVWHWFRPGGALKLAEVAQFFVGRQLAVLGLDPDLAEARLNKVRAA